MNSLVLRVNKLQFTKFFLRQFWRVWTLFIRFMELRTRTVGFRAPAFPFFLLLVQLKILNVDKTASRGEETAKKSKTKTQGESFLFLFLSKKKWNLGCIVFIFIHFLIKSQRTPTELGRLRRM